VELDLTAFGLVVNETEEKNKKKKEAVKKAEKKKKAVTETMEEAWERIFKMKNKPPELAKLQAVKMAMDAGTIGRLPEKAGTQFSKTEALELYKALKQEEKMKKLQEMRDNKPDNYYLVNTRELLLQLKRDIIASNLISVDCETYDKNGVGTALDPWKGGIAGFSVTTENDRHYYVPLNHVKGEQLTETEVFNELTTTLEGAKTVMHNAPFDCKLFQVQYGINLIDNLHADTYIMAMGLEENVDHGLKELCKAWLKIDGDSYNTYFKKGEFHRVDLDLAVIYAAGDTEKTMKLYKWMLKHYDNPKRPDLQKIKRLVFEIEMPIRQYFIKADLRGLRFDVEQAKKLDKQFAEEIAEIEAEIYRLAGKEFNISSPQQLSKLLFKELKLTDIENGSTSTKNVLKKIAHEHPIVPKLMEWREVAQLRKAFTKKLPENVQPDGKIHQSHNTWGAVTGRFTCSNPNTQQMPAKRPEIRKLFLTDENRIFVSIDYSQIELRVLAHLSNDPVLIDAFKTGKDIHSTTAAQISGIPYEQIERTKDVDGSPEQKARKDAKPVNFGIVYGMTSTGLATQLNKTKEEAQVIIDKYFKAYPSIKSFMNKQSRQAQKYGYVDDCSFGRKRRLRDALKRSKNGALRQAGNFPIQSFAGSILKKAIVDLIPVIEPMGVNILLQIHDELLFDCPADITREQLETIRETMKNAVKLRVPVECDIEIYPRRWMEKVSIDEWFESRKA
jgi:DNA polymerase I